MARKRATNGSATGGGTAIIGFGANDQALLASSILRGR